MKQGEQGTVIHGTMRTYDLIVAFIEELRHLHAEAYQQLCHPAVGHACVPGDAQGDERHPFWDSEDASSLLESLFEALDHCAPEGHYFGAHPGDGADYGFWPLED